MLRGAMEIERTTETFYRDHRRQTEDPAAQTLFSRLAEVERAHFLFVSSLVTYFDRPAEWIESAEFGLRDEY